VRNGMSTNISGRDGSIHASNQPVSEAGPCAAINRQSSEDINKLGLVKEYQ